MFSCHLAIRARVKVSHAKRKMGMTVSTTRGNSLLQSGKRETPEKELGLCKTMSADPSAKEKKATQQKKQQKKRRTPPLKRRGELVR